jgi:hypothetical protein
MMQHNDLNASDLRLSANCRKALTVQLGDAAGREVADLLSSLAERIERLEQSKVDIMPIVRQDVIRRSAA